MHQHHCLFLNLPTLLLWQYGIQTCPAIEHLHLLLDVFTTTNYKKICWKLLKILDGKTLSFSKNQPFPIGLNTALFRSATVSNLRTTANSRFNCTLMMVDFDGSFFSDTNVDFMRISIHNLSNPSAEVVLLTPFHLGTRYFSDIRISASVIDWVFSKPEFYWGWVFSRLLKDGGGVKKPPPSLISVTHTYNDETWHSYTLPKEDRKNTWITSHTPWLLLTSAFCHRKSANFAISWNTDIDCVLIHNLHLY